MALIDTETLDQYQKSLDDDAHWLTEYAQDKGAKVGQCIINITVTMHRAAWALRELMKSLPSAQPTIEPRAKGHWIELPGAIGVAYCSECNHQLTENNTNFCPNCGADMREVTE